MCILHEQFTSICISYILNALQSRITGVPVLLAYQGGPEWLFHIERMKSLKKGSLFFQKVLLGLRDSDKAMEVRFL